MHSSRARSLFGGASLAVLHLANRLDRVQELHCVRPQSAFLTWHWWVASESDTAWLWIVMLHKRKMRPHRGYRAGASDTWRTIR